MRILQLILYQPQPLVDILEVHRTVVLIRIFTAHAVRTERRVGNRYSERVVCALTDRIQATINEGLYT